VLDPLLAALMPMATLFAAIGGGALLGGWAPRLGPLAGTWMGRVTPVLVALQGVAVGGAPEVVAQLPVLGLRALVIALAAMGGSVALAWLWLGVQGIGAQGSLQSHAAGAAVHPLRASASMALALGVGVVAGALGLWPVGGSWPSIGDAAWWSVLVLCVLIGVDLGSGDLRARLRETGRGLLRVPCAVVVGSLVGGALVGLWLGPVAPASAAGFGWYSLAGPLVTQSMGAEAGAVAFLANLMRELVALLLIPVVVAQRPAGSALGAALAGAPAMDTALPFLARYGGGEAALVGLVSGATVSVLAPVLVTLIAAAFGGAP